MSRLHPFARLCIAALGLLVLLNVAGLILAAGYGVFDYVNSPRQVVEETVARTVKWSTDAAIVLNLFAYPVGLLWLGFCRAKFDKRSFVSLGLRRPRLGNDAVRGIVAGFLSIAVVWAILWITGTISVNGWSEAARAPTAALALLGWLLAFAAVGFFEELTFRGYALHNLTNWLGWKWAVIVQATIFALIHLGNVIVAPRDAKLAALGAMPAIFLIGVFFALSYRKTGSLWFAIGFHSAWNFSLGCLFSLPVSGIKTFQLLDVQNNASAFLSGGAFGAEGSFLLLPVILALIWFMWQAPDHPQALLDLELVQPAPAPPTVEVPALVPVIAGESGWQTEEEDRENRYRTKFGTSEGFDESMLRELRELQQERETREAQTRRDREAEQTVLQTELLRPPATSEELAPQAEQIVEEETVVVASTPKVEPVEAPQQPSVAQTSVAQTSVAQTSVAQPEIESKIEEQAAPVVEQAPKSAPAPAPPKKARPKW